MGLMEKLTALKLTALVRDTRMALVEAVETPGHGPLEMGNPG